MPAIHSTSRAVARWLVASLCAITGAMAQVNAADRSGTVKGTRSAQGLVLAALHGSAGASLKPGKHAAAQIATADAQGVTVVFRNLPAGRYPLTAFHDENSNGKLDFNLTGSPVEALGVSNAAFGTAAAPSFAQAAADPWLADFQRAVAAQPWVLGYRIPAGDVAGASAPVSGRFQPAVQGVLFRNGPATHDMGGLRYQHWFDGDGMVQRHAITATGVTRWGKAAESSSSPYARLSRSATLPAVPRCTRRWPHSTSRA